MKILFYGIIPVFFIYTDKFIQLGAATYFIGPLCIVLVKPKYRNDKGLHNHEMVHVRQYWKSFWLHTFRYNDSEKYRLQCECEAYAVQYKSYPDEKHFNLFVEYMMEKYSLGFDHHTIENMFIREIKDQGIRGYLPKDLGPSSLRR